MRDERYITKIVAACLLGDGGICKDKRDNGNATFNMNMTETSKPYLEHIATIIEPITSTNIYQSGKLRQGVIDGVECTLKPTFVLQSKRHPFYTKFHNRMYSTGKKCVDPHYLKLLDWEFLAHWYMQDGSLSGYLVSNKYPTLEIDLCSHSFSYAENMFLRSKLKDTLNLDFNLRANNYKNGVLYSLRTRKKETIERFIEQVKPYMHEVFKYKVDTQGKTQYLLSRATGPANSG